MNYLSYLFLVIIALLLMILYDLYAAFLFGMLLLVVPLLSLAAGYALRHSVTVTLTAPYRARRGEAVEVCLSARGRYLPFFSSLSATLAGREYDSYEKEKSEVRFYFRVGTAHAGRITLPAARLFWKDPFGLFHFHKDTEAATLLVLPRPMGDYAHTLQSLLRLSGSEEMEYFGATPYQPGDNPRLINWKVTARTEDVYVRDRMPADDARLILAADYEEDDVLRDLLADALLSCGLALTAARMPFRFAWMTIHGEEIITPVKDKAGWEEAVATFLREGGGDALKTSHLSPYIPICYLTGDPAPAVSPVLHPSIWCVRDAKGAALSGKAAIARALGGEA